jgi:hypothetical protein
MTAKSIPFLIGGILLLGAAAAAQEAPSSPTCLVVSTSSTPSACITLTVGANSRSYAIPLDFSGLSFGTISMKEQHKAYLFESGDTQALTLFQQMGIRNLRIGGSSVDDNSTGYKPDDKDIDALFGFAQAADLKVIYSLTLLNNDPTQSALSNRGAAYDARKAAYITENYGALLANFAIGNEPNDYHGEGGINNFSEYLTDWDAFASDILAKDASARFGGPDGGSSKKGNSWGTQFAENVLIASPIEFHYYVGDSDKNLSSQRIIDDMLSRDWVETNYPEEYKTTGELVLARPRLTPLFVPAYRFTEADAFYTGGGDGIAGGDNSFASALFSLDFMHYWAGQNLSGVNFHTTEWKYNGTLYKDASGDYQVYPVGYGIKAFDLGGHGYVQPVAVSNPDGINVTAYAVGDGLDTYVTIINKTHNASHPEEANLDTNAVVTIQPTGIAAASAAALFLAGDAPGDGASLTATLGGAAILNSSQWQGQWSPLSPEIAGAVTVTVPPATAAVVRIHAASSYAGPIQLNQDGTLEIFGFDTSTGQDIWNNGQYVADLPDSALSAWTGWTDLAGGVYSSGAVAVAKNLDNTLEIFVPSTGGDVYSNQQAVPDGSWSGWTDMGSGSSGMTHLQVSNQGDGSLALFGIGPNGDVWSSSQSAPRSSWSSWTDLSGEQIQPGFVASQNLSGSVELFGVDGQGNVWTSSQNHGGAWSGWSRLPGVAVAPELAIARNVDGRLELFGVDALDNVWHTWQTLPGGSWSAWSEIQGGQLQPGFVAGQQSDGRLALFGLKAGAGVTLPNGNVLTAQQDTPGGSFSDNWTNLSGSLIDARLVVGNTLDGRIQLFGIGQNNDVWSDWQTGNGGWAGWSDFGGQGIAFYPQAQQTPPPQPASFTVSASPANVTLTLTANAMSDIAVVPQNGFSGSVTLSAAGLPPGVIASFSPNPTNSTTSTLTLEEGSTIPPGTYSVTITGTSGSLTSSTSLTLTIAP